MAIFVLVYIYVFIVGACIASFMNVVIYRVPNHLDFVRGRSFCPKCHNTLYARDMIPILSWILRKGKCRFCGEPISFRYPFVECIGGILGVLLFHRYGFSWDTILVFAFAMILLAIAMVDLDTMEIPNGFILFCVLLAIFFFILHPEIGFINRCVGFFIVSVPMYLMNILIVESFGGGDIKLMAVCGFILGFKNILLAMFIGVILAGVYAIYLVGSRKTSKKDYIAFGPYLCVGIMIALLYGNDIIHAYLSFFGL